MKLRFQAGSKPFYHLTLPSIADRIKVEGFKPLPFLEHKYYAPTGREGCYFYDNLRMIERYAYHLAGKTKIHSLSLVVVNLPTRVGIDGAALEDGVFVPTADLGQIELLRIQEFQLKIPGGWTIK